MIVPLITYIVLAISGLLGSAIAWDELQALKKPSPKEEVKH